MNQEQVTINDIKLWVNYDYTEGEKATDDTPGYPSEIRIIEVRVDGTDWEVTDILTIGEHEEIEQQLLKLHEG